MAASRRSQHHHHHHQQQLQPAPGASAPPPPPPPPLSPGLAPGTTPASPTVGGLAPFASPRHGLALPEGDGSRDPPDRPRSPDPVDSASCCSPTSTICTVAAAPVVPAVSASSAVGVAPSPAGGGSNNSPSSSSSPTSSSSSSPSSPGSSLAESPEAAGVSATAPLGPGAAGPGPGVPAVSGALRELLEACRNGDVSRVKRLVDAANVNAKDMAGRKSSPLHFAAEKDDVCVFQEISVLNPGQSMIKYLEGDFCYMVECLEEKDNHTGFHTLNFTMVNCLKECDIHQVYTPSPSDYDCCGTCKNVSCKFQMANGTTVIYEEGSTWHYNCTTFECVKTDEGAMILNYSMVCPPFNETECKMNEGIVKLYNEGCCRICKREERICQKVIIKSIIRKQDCISQSSINVASCDGKCPSATIYNINIESHLRFCKCCRENGVRNLTVPLYCSGNGTEVLHTLQEPIDCTCQWN